MANRNFSEFTLRSVPSNPLASNDYLVGYSGNNEVRVTLSDLLTNATTNSGINLSVRNSGFQKVFQNFYSGSEGKMYPNWGYNGYTFNNVVIGSYHSVSGRGAIAIGNGANVVVPNWGEDYYTSLGSLVWGNWNTLSAAHKNSMNLVLGVSNKVTALDPIAGVLPANQSRNMIFVYGAECKFSAVSSTLPYTSQLSNGAQLTSYYDSDYGGGANLIAGLYNEIHDSSVGGYLRNFNQAKGNIIYGNQCKMYGGDGNIIFGFQNTLSGQSEYCFAAGAYNTLHETYGLFTYGIHNNANISGNCSQGYRILLGVRNNIGRVRITTPSGIFYKIGNVCGSSLIIGDYNTGTSGDNLIFGNNNIMASEKNFVFGNNNKVSVCNFLNNGSDSKIGAYDNQIILGNNNSTGVWYWENNHDGIIHQETPCIFLGVGLSAQYTAGAIAIGNTHRLERSPGSISLGFNLSANNVKRLVMIGSNIKMDNGSNMNDTFAIALDRNNINNNTFTVAKRSEQFLLSARGGTFIPGKVGIGIDTMNSATSAALHVNAAGTIIFSNLPTSVAGLPTGALWNNSGVLSVA
jgi:hypothetical protein